MSCYHIINNAHTYYPDCPSCSIQAKDAEIAALKERLRIQSDNHSVTLEAMGRLVEETKELQAQVKALAVEIARHARAVFLPPGEAEIVQFCEYCEQMQAHTPDIQRLLEAEKAKDAVVEEARALLRTAITCAGLNRSNLDEALAALDAAQKKAGK